MSHGKTPLMHAVSCRATVPQVRRPVIAVLFAVSLPMLICLSVSWRSPLTAATCCAESLLNYLQLYYCHVALAGWLARGIAQVWGQQGTFHVRNISVPAHHS